ncbi:MAG: hypothetical protein NZ518_01990, partial [Dehalococcoidia bacterium]|nr:hypothetical protein [Dehalococcoidia bacterium]
PLPTVQLSSATYSVAENGGSAPITVTLSNPSVFTVTTAFTTSDGTALAGTHYVGASATVTFTPGVTQVVVSVGITDDLVFNFDRTFTVTLSGPVNATLGTPATATVTINESSVQPQTPPNQIVIVSVWRQTSVP